VVTRVYLVPGFFGFASLGGLHYFHHVKEALDEAFRSCGVAVEVHRVDTLPTATIARRAQRLLDVIAQTAGDDGGPIHLVGHSTGALDARLLLDPDRNESPELLSRARSVVSVAGAHRGTPLAAAFRTAFGKELLKLLALMTVRTLRLGPLPVAVITGLASVLATFDSAVGAKADLVDELQRQLLDDLTVERRLALHTMFQEIANDQALLDELTPERAQHLDAQTLDRAGVTYACIVAEARRPGVWSTVAAGLSPYAQASHMVYQALYRLAGRASPMMRAPPQALAARDALVKAFGDMPTAEDSDGIVPVYSQFHGRLLGAVKADHHDVIGHFDDSSTDPPHIDWLLTGTGFSRDHFDALWRDVAAFVLNAERP
jgi:triacylglycerol esterase/lipase EstA (alpha/beta hydrolase family)